MRNGADAVEAREELWAESVRRYNAERERESRAEWYGYLMASAERTERVAAEIAAAKRARAEKLLEDGAA